MTPIYLPDTWEVVPYLRSNSNENNLKSENFTIWFPILVIQKKSSNTHTDDAGGENDKGSIMPIDRTANLDITNESASNIEGSGVEDVEAEG